MKKLSIAIRMILALTIVLSHESPGQSVATAKKIDELIAPVAATNQFSGVVLASENGKVIYEKAFGMANVELNVPNTVNSRIGIASITKPMTSIILLRLIEEQKLTLEDKLSKFIPDFPNGDKITIAMLAQHRSGIPHRLMPEDQETRPYTSVEMVEKAKAAKLVFEPGAERLYSSGGFTVLTRVLEIASGQTYQQLLQKYVLDPAGMKNSLDWNGPAIIERRAQDYLRDERGYVNAAIKDYSFLVGAGSVISTASDLHKFATTMVDGVFGASAKASFVREGQFGSSGNTNGHRAVVEMKADKSYGLVILSNMGCGSFDFLQRGLSEILQGKEPALKTLTIPRFNTSANKDLNEFTGLYKQTGGSETAVKLIDGYLYAADIKLHPVKPDCFFDFKFYGDVCFGRDAAGKVNGIRWKGLTYELTWVKQ
jgi:CubicO group peptidase (beta-lactamase class C family)